MVPQFLDLSDPVRPPVFPLSVIFIFSLLQCPYYLSEPFKVELVSPFLSSLPFLVPRSYSPLFHRLLLCPFFITRCSLSRVPLACRRLVHRWPRGLFSWQSRIIF
jgi:hypothetical protein